MQVEDLFVMECAHGNGPEVEKMLDSGRIQDHWAIVTGYAFAVLNHLEAVPRMLRGRYGTLSHYTTMELQSAVARYDEKRDIGPWRPATELEQGREQPAQEKKQTQGVEGEYS